MGLFRRWFPGQEVRAALESVSDIEKALPEAVGPQLGFDVIKGKLQNYITQNPEALSKALKGATQSIDVLVMILARNFALDELASGQHMTFGTQTTMAGSGLISLFNHLTSSLEDAGAITDEEAREARTGLREMIQERFG